MNKQTFLVSMMVLEHPGRWMDISDMAYELNMTKRQIKTAIGLMHVPNVRKDGSMAVMADMLPDEAERRIRDLKKDYYGISEQDERDVKQALSTIGWTSMSDVSALTGFNIARLNVILSVTDGIVEGTDGSKRMLALARR